MIDEIKTRIVAALQVTLLGLYLFTGNENILFIIVYDFFVRLYLTFLLSPIALIATGLTSLFTYEKYNAESLEKEFAMHIALIIVSVTLAAGLFEYTIFSFSLVLLLLVWKILEATKNICLGCQLYKLLQRSGIEIVSL